MWVDTLFWSTAAFFLGRYVGKRSKAKREKAEKRIELPWDDDDDDDAEIEAIDTDDSWEGSFWEASEAKDVATTVEIEYRDANGTETHRVVHTRSFDNRLNGGLLIGHCALRAATRSFRFDRILSAVDISTGEVIPDLKAHLNALYEDSPSHSVDALHRRYTDLLNVLVFVARADGQYRREEKVVVRDFCRELVSDPRISGAAIDGIFKNLGTPSLQRFKASVGKVLDQQLCQPKKLVEICTQIVDTQDSRTAGEVEALDYLSKRIDRFRLERGAAA